MYNCHGVRASLSVMLQTRRKDRETETKTRKVTERQRLER